MKPGDKFAVHLNEHVVAEAVVIDIEDDKVTLDIPATRIVMGVKSSLTDLPDQVTEKDRILLGDDSKPQSPSISGTQTIQPAPSTPVQAPVVETPAPSTLPADSTLPPDAIGEGLANVQLKEMD